MHRLLHSTMAMTFSVPSLCTMPNRLQPATAAFTPDARPGQ